VRSDIWQAVTVAMTSHYDNRPQWSCIQNQKVSECSIIDCFSLTGWCHQCSLWA